MKRILYVVVVCLLMIGLISAGCPEPEPEPEPVELESCVVVMDDYVVGQDWYGYDDIPNGFLTFPMEPCLDVEALGTGQVSIIAPLQAEEDEVYDVEGADCAEVYDKIFDLAAGLGFLVAGNRYAGKCRMMMTVRCDDLGNSVEITAVEWTTVIILPDWTNKAQCQGNRPQDVTEWDRCMAAGLVHEEGHREIFNDEMPGVRAAAVGDTVQVGVGLSDDQKCAAAQDYVRNTAEFQAMLQSQAAYEQQTNHGQAQGAVLTCPP